MQSTSTLHTQQDPSHMSYDSGKNEEKKKLERSNKIYIKQYLEVVHVCVFVCAEKKTLKKIFNKNKWQS